MLQQLFKFLILNKKASIPGIGIFHIDRKPASLDFSNKAFVAPAAQISFTQGAVAADKKFYSFLSAGQQIDHAEAIERFENFSERLKNDLNSNGTVQLPGIGLLSKDASGAIKFQPAKNSLPLFADVSTERTIRAVSNVTTPPKASHKVKDKGKHSVVGNGEEVDAHKKDYWWLLSILLAAVAIAAIIYYYNQHGGFR